MSIKAKGDNASIALAIKEMKEEGILYKANGKPNIPELMERTGLSKQRARWVASNGFKLLPHGNEGKIHVITLSTEEGLLIEEHIGMLDERIDAIDEIESELESSFTGI